jgi:hypothetical protein
MEVGCNHGLRSSAGRGWLVAGALFAVACSMDSSPSAVRSRPSPSQSGSAAGGPTGGAAGSGAVNGGFSNPGDSIVAGTGGTTIPPVAGTSGSDTCAQGTANATPITPIVWLVVDGSSSMNEPFDGAATRWQTLRATLMDPGGVVASLEAVAEIGMVIYSGNGGGLLGGTGECVNLVTVEPALNNYTNLDAQYPQDPIGTGTPTDRALDHVVTNLPVTNQQVLDMEQKPVYVVLATDGQPNDPCGEGLLGGGVGDAAVEQRVIDVTTRGTQMGMNMFIISLAGGDTALQSHLEQVARATSTMTPPFVPATQAELVGTFLDIIGGAACTVGLDGTVSDGQQCRGEVVLNGSPLACDSDNGWRLTDPRTVQLTGSACMDFQSNASQVHASFPCDVFAPD